MKALVFAMAVMAGLAVMGYFVSLDAAADYADREKEEGVTKLSARQGPIERGLSPRSYRRRIRRSPMTTSARSSGSASTFSAIRATRLQPSWATICAARTATLTEAVSATRPLSGPPT